MCHDLLLRRPRVRVGKQSGIVVGVLVFLFACTWGAGAHAQEDAVSRHRGERTPSSSAEEKGSGFEKKSFWFIGTSNYHLRLKESEDEINMLLNGALGSLFPRWKEPTTFKDWSEDWRIWDLWVGYGRDINARSSWSVYAGGGAGTVPNTERYFPLGVPLKLDIDFTRRSYLVGSSVSYYPFGRPEKTGRGIREILRETRPVGEINVGYTHQTRIGDVSASLPFIGEVLHYKDEKKYGLFWGSPRLGIEIPLAKQDSLNLLGGYLFFFDHAGEYNGILFEAFVRHRF